MSNNKEAGSIRALMITLRQGQPWGSWRGSVRLIDGQHVDTAFGAHEVTVEGETVYLLRDGERRLSINAADYGRLLAKNLDKWTGAGVAEGDV